MPTTKDLLNSDYTNAQLDASEQARLKELETVIKQGLQTFYEVGKALDEIREKRLYRETHKTFEGYCREKWGIARRTADQFIGAVKVMENLSAIGAQIPTKERQVRPLTGLPPQLQLEIWQEAVELAPKGIPSGAAIQRLVDQRVSSRSTRRNSGDASSEVEQLRQENQQLKERLRQQNLERKQRAAEVSAKLERLREENRQLKAELRQRDIDWEVRLAYEREKILEEVKAEYEGQINALTTQLTLPRLSKAKAVGFLRGLTLNIPIFRVPGRNPFAAKSGLLSLPSSKLLKRDFPDVPGQVLTSYTDEIILAD